MRTEPDSQTHNLHPIWSPAGQQIAFVANRSKPGLNINIYVLPADGGRLTQVAEHALRKLG